MKKLILFLFIWAKLFLNLSFGQVSVQSAYITVERISGLSCKAKAVVYASGYQNLQPIFTTTLREKQTGNVIGNYVLNLQSATLDSSFSTRSINGVCVYSGNFVLPSYGVHYELMGTACCIDPIFFQNCGNLLPGISFLPSCDFVIPNQGTFKLPDFVIGANLSNSFDSLTFSSYNCIKGDPLTDSFKYEIIAPQISKNCGYPTMNFLSIDSSTGMLVSKDINYFVFGVKCSMYRNGIYCGATTNTLRKYQNFGIGNGQDCIQWKNFLSRTYNGQKEFTVVKNVPFHLSLLGMNLLNDFMYSQTKGELMLRTQGKPSVVTNTTFNAQYKYYNYTFDWTPTTQDVRKEPYFTTIRLFSVDSSSIPGTCSDLLLKLKVVSSNSAEEVDPYAEFLPVYPNPVNGYLFVPFMLRKQSNVVVRFYDALGRVVKTESLSSQPMGRNEVGMDVSELSRGNYILEVVTQSGELVNRQRVQVKN